jgi:SPP1 family predicted phage head-tail adaptor
MWRDVGKLVTVTYTQNTMKDMIENKTKRDVYVNKKGVKRAEFYQAMATGLKPELVVEIKEIDYNEEELFEFNGKEYKIYRTYPTKNECVELVCTGLVVD